MIHITVSLPDDVAQQYYTASEKLSAELSGTAPNPQTLMRFMLAGYNSDDIARHFDHALRNITGAPMPNESETWVFSQEFDQAP